MTPIVSLASAIFIFGYAAIALEHRLKLNKSAVALLIGGLLWILAVVAVGDHAVDELLHASTDIFGILIFLLSAMALVEILVHYKLFDVIRGRLYSLGLSDKGQFFAISVLAFFLSAVIDNLTTAIVMIQIASRFFKGKNLVRAAAAVVIAANAGGAFSPIGDVTTIMLWLAGKFSAVEVIVWGFLPSLTLALVAVGLLGKGMKGDTSDSREEIVTKLSRSERGVIGLVLASFLLPLAMNFFGLPPYLGLLLGLGGVWIVVDLLKQIRPRPTHLEASIDELIRKVDIPSLKFFVGILLAVSALNALGILEQLSHVLYGSSPSDMRVIAGNTGLGIVSAILDNVPLTAIAIEILPVSDTGLWVLLALAVGTGGSLLVIGSAAGVVAMGMVKEMTFGAYLRIATLPALAGYAAGMGVWILQRILFA